MASKILKLIGGFWGIYIFFYWEFETQFADQHINYLACVIPNRLCKRTLIFTSRISIIPGLSPETRFSRNSVFSEVPFTFSSQSTWAQTFVGRHFFLWLFFWSFAKHWRKKNNAKVFRDESERERPSIYKMQHFYNSNLSKTNINILLYVSNSHLSDCECLTRCSVHRLVCLNVFLFSNVTKVVKRYLLTCRINR